MFLLSVACVFGHAFCVCLVLGGCEKHQAFSYLNMTLKSTGHTSMILQALTLHLASRLVSVYMYIATDLDQSIKIDTFRRM